MYSELSLLDLVLNASIVVQLVLASLVLASLISWTMIFDRSRVLKRARRAADEFEQRFWSGGDLSALYRDLEKDKNAPTVLPPSFGPASRSTCACARATTGTHGRSSRARSAPCGWP